MNTHPPTGPLRPEVTARQRDAPSGAIGVWMVSQGGFRFRRPALRIGETDRIGRDATMFEGLSDKLSGILDREKKTHEHRALPPGRVGRVISILERVVLTRPRSRFGEGGSTME